MTFEFTPEQQQLLERAARSGMSPEDVLVQAFAVIQNQFDCADWMAADRERIAAHIEEGFRQAERGELIEGDDVSRILNERHSKHPL